MAIITPDYVVQSPELTERKLLHAVYDGQIEAFPVDDFWQKAAFPGLAAFHII
jgi:hypothetical protein